MKKELISIFLDNLYPEKDEKSVLLALDLCNEYFQEHRDDITEDDLVALYDSAREYAVHWPQPLGLTTAGAVGKRPFFSGDRLTFLIG